MAEEIRRMRQKYGTTTQWDTANPTLTKGEIGYEDLGDGSWLGKLGDGSTPWTDLPYYLNMTNAIPRSVTANYDILKTDIARDLYVNSASEVRVTIPTDVGADIPLYSQIAVWKIGNGTVIVEADTGVDLNDVTAGSLTLPGKYSVVFLQKIGANAWQGVNNSYGINELRVVATSPTVTTIDVEVHLNAATLTATLPPRADLPVGKFYYIKDIAGSAQTIAADGADTINGSSTYAMVADQTVRLVNNGIEWSAQTIVIGSDDVTNQSSVSGASVSAALEYLDINSLTTKSTHIEYGGELSINVGDPSKVDIAPGAVVVVDSHTDDAAPTAVRYTWASPIVYDPTLLPTNPVSYISIGAGGTILNSATYPSALQRRSYGALGIALHEDNLTIRKAISTTFWGQDILGLVGDLNLVLGGVISSNGNVFSANGANLKLDKSAGNSVGIGINKGVDAETPNTTTDPAQSALTFVSFYRGGAGIGVPNITSNVPVDQYDPNGNGVLVDLPSGYFTNHRIYFDGVTDETVLVYGQFAYDSLKKAVDSAEAEGFDTLAETSSIPLRSVLSVQEGSTVLNARDVAKFTEAGLLGERAFKPAPNYSSFAEAIEISDALTYQRPSISLLSDGGVLYADIESVDGEDITFIFGQLEHVLNCTSGAGVGGSARIALTAGTATSPQKNYISAVPNGTTTTLQATTSYPSGEHAMICSALLPDVTSFDSYDAYGSRRWTNAKEVEGVGIVATILRKLRDLPVGYLSGLTPTLSINPATNPDEVDFSTATGQVRQVYDLTIEALQLSVDGALVVNDETTPYTRITDLNEITTDTNGASLLTNNSFFQIVVGVSTNTDGSSRLLVNKPSGKYSSASDAFNDVSAYSSTNFPGDFDTVSLICAFVFRYQTAGGTYTNAATSFGVDFVDLRGLSPGSASQGSGSAAIQEFSASAFAVFDDGDNTKELGFDVSEVPTSTKALITMSPYSRNVGHDPIVPVTGTSKTFAVSDQDTEQECENASAQTLTIPTNASVAYPVGTHVNGYQFGAGTVTIQGDTGVTLNGVSAGSVATTAQYGRWVLIKRDTDEWVISGDVV